MTVEPIPAIEPAPRRGDRVALRLMQAGIVGVVPIVSTYRVFELDRFFVPKELVLHSTALLAALFLLGSIVRMPSKSVDGTLSVWLGLSALSALFATNHWLGMRATALTASGIVLFWAARALRRAGLERGLLTALAIAVAAVAVGSLLQTYGLETDLFSENRAPGGTLGNRNFVAHAAAFGFPLLLLAAFRAKTRRSAFAAAVGTALVVATLVLTRSRAAWLAFAVVGVVCFASLLVSRALRRDGTTWRRALLVALLSGVAVGAALTIPNSLRWHSDNPYLESVQRVADYKGGSGRGRLIQYTRSMVMAAHHPLLGVGPGNWAVVYPLHAIKNDPSLDDVDRGTTSNPWPSSDWVAALSERGLPALVALVLVFWQLAAGSVRALLRAGEVAGATEAMARIGIVTGAAMTGLFDAVLLLALPTLLVWTALGALWEEAPGGGDAAPMRRWALLLALTACGVGVVRSGAQLAAMDLFATRSDRASLERAAQIDPGNYRVQLRLARGGARKQRCEHALAAHELYPQARVAAALARGCGK